MTARKKKLKEIKLNFFYRKSIYQCIYYSFGKNFKGTNRLKEEIQKKQNEFIERKKFSQPSQIKTCGSTFKNLNSEKSLATN